MPIIASGFCISTNIIHVHSSCSRNALGLGKHIYDDISNAASRYHHSSVNPLKSISVPLLTDHPVLKYSMAHVTLYDAGFVITDIDHIKSMPVCISFPMNVDRVWIVTVDDMISHCIRYWQSLNTNIPNATALLKHLYDLPIHGLFIVMRLRDFNYASTYRNKGRSDSSTAVSDEETDFIEMVSAMERSFVDGNTDNQEFRETYIHNPLSAALPFIATNSHNSKGGYGRYMALHFNTVSLENKFTLSPSTIFSTNNSNTILTNILSRWKSVFTRLQIPCFVGKYY